MIAICPLSCRWKSISEVDLENCLIVGHINFDDLGESSEYSMSIRNSTVLNCEQNCSLLLLTMYRTPHPQPVQATHFQASGSVLDSASPMMTFAQPRALVQHPLGPEEAQAWLKQRIIWRADHNLYRTRGAYLDDLVTSGEVKDFARTELATDRAAWNQFWTLTDTDSVEDLIRYQGGDLHAKARSSLGQLTPEDFRLRPDSAGYQGGPNGEDIGANIDFVGPGEAYERWQQTDAYRMWREEADALVTGRLDRVPRVDHVSLAVEYAEQERYDEAARAFSDALDSTTDGATDRRRVHILEQVLQWEGMFDRLVELRPHDINLWRERGGIKARESQWEEAANCLRKRLDLGPDGGGTWNWCAIALLAIDDDEGYREFCARMLTEFQLNPNPFEHRDIAWAAVYAPINDEGRERCLESAEKALAGLSEDGDVFRLYAAWLYRHDRLEEATEWFDRSVDQGGLWEGNGEFAWCFAAMAHHRLGQEESASHWRKHVLEWRESLNERLTPEYSWWPVVGDRLIEEMNQVFAGATEASTPDAAARDAELPPPPPSVRRNDIQDK